MKQTFLLISLILAGLNSGAQTGLDKSLESISYDLSQKLKSTEKKRIGVMDITDINKAITPTGKYMADVVSIHLENFPGIFEVIDRQNLDQLLKEQRLNYQGYIDATTAKQLSKVLALDIIVTGTYTVLSDKVTLSLKAIDSETAMLLASSIKSIPMDADLAALLGINYSPNGDDGLGRRGFNGPVPSNEDYNNPGTVSNECANKKYGDYCFQNRSKEPLRVLFKISGASSLESSTQINLTPGQTSCSFRLPAGVYKYSAIFDNPNGVTLVSDVQKGEFLVEQCKSKTLTISR